MSSNETVAKIVREMRNDAIAADAWHETYGEMASAASTLNRHADRIEKAHNREIAAKDAEITELRECLQLAIQMKCANCGLCIRGVEPCYPDGEIVHREDCWMIMKWRKALEGGTNDR